MTKTKMEANNSTTNNTAEILNIPKPPMTTTNTMNALAVSATATAAATTTIPSTDSHSDVEDDGIVELDDGKSGKLTLATLIQEDLIQPGVGVMTIDYLGQTFKGDLLSLGKIKSQETGLIFNNPSAWAIYCKKIVNPAKKSGCGWASVKYKGKKMDYYKNAWLKLKYQDGRDDNQQLQQQQIMQQQQLHQQQKQHLEQQKQLQQKQLQQQQQQQQQLLASHMLQLQQLNLQSKKCIIQHSQLGPKMPGDYVDTLVEMDTFASMGKIQPFTVSISSSALLIMSLHSHLHDDPVCGYLAGQWDLNSHNLAVTHIFPCYMRTKAEAMSVLDAKKIEGDVYNGIYDKHLTLVGWYHSEPNSDNALPSLKDGEAQLEYQIKMLGTSDATYTPCIGMITTTFSKKPNNETNAYWVLPPPETPGPQEYGKPMLMNFSTVTDPCLSQEVLDQIDESLSHFNKNKNRCVKFHQIFHAESGMTYITKLGMAIVPHFPRDQDERLWRYIRNKLLDPEHRNIDDPILASHELFKLQQQHMQESYNGKQEQHDDEEEIDDDEENALLKQQKMNLLLNSVVQLPTVPLPSSYVLRTSVSTPTSISSQLSILRPTLPLSSVSVSTNGNTPLDFSTTRANEE